MLRGWRTRLRRLNSSEESTMRRSSDSKARRRRQWGWLRNFSLARRAASCESNTSALSSWSSECKVRNMRERVGREQGAGREQLRKPAAVPRAAIREAGVEAGGRGGPSRVRREAGEQAEGEQPHLPPAAADPPLKVKRREALHEDLLLCEERQSNSPSLRKAYPLGQSTTSIRSCGSLAPQTSGSSSRPLKNDNKFLLLLEVSPLKVFLTRFN